MLLVNHCKKLLFSNKRNYELKTLNQIQFKCIGDKQNKPVFTYSIPLKPLTPKLSTLIKSCKAIVVIDSTTPWNKIYGLKNERCWVCNWFGKSNRQWWFKNWNTNKAMYIFGQQLTFLELEEASYLWLLLKLSHFFWGTINASEKAISLKQCYATSPKNCISVHDVSKNCHRYSKNLRRWWERQHRVLQNSNINTAVRKGGPFAIFRTSVSHLTVVRPNYY